MALIYGGNIRAGVPINKRIIFNCNFILTESRETVNPGFGKTRRTEIRISTLTVEKQSESCYNFQKINYNSGREETGEQCMPQIQF